MTAKLFPGMKKIHLLLFLPLLLVMCKGGEKKLSVDTVKSIDNDITYKTLFTPDSIEPAVTCYRIPALITAPNGDLIAVADQRLGSCGDLKWNRDINIVMRRSTDHGKTWLDMETVIDYPSGQSASDASMIVDKEMGTIFMFFNYMNLDESNKVFYLRYIKSTDNGKTWSQPIDITSQITKPSWEYDFKFITSGRGVQTKDGKLFHTLVNLQRGLHVFGSNDHGDSWYLIDTPLQYADESKIMELADGRWMINARVKDAGCRYVYLSDDNGQTWTSYADSSLIDPACNASLIRYSAKSEGGAKYNRLLFSNAAFATERINMNIRMSEDEGNTWAYSRIIYQGSAAYSSMSVLQDGYIGILFENDDYSKITFSRFSVDAIIQGDEKQ